MHEFIMLLSDTIMVNASCISAHMHTAMPTITYLSTACFVSHFHYYIPSSMKIIHMHLANNSDHHLVDDQPSHHVMFIFMLIFMSHHTFMFTFMIHVMNGIVTTHFYQIRSISMIVTPYLHDHMTLFITCLIKIEPSGGSACLLSMFRGIPFDCPPTGYAELNTTYQPRYKEDHPPQSYHILHDMRETSTT